MNILMPISHKNLSSLGRICVLSGISFTAFLALCPIPVAAATQVSPAGLIGHWTFDDGSGTAAADSSGNGYAGTLVNAPGWVPGFDGTGLSFTNTGATNAKNHVRFPSALNGTNFPTSGSLAFWIKGTFTGQNFRSVIGQSTSGPNRLFVRARDSDNGLQFGLQNAVSTYAYSKGAPATADTWTHFAFTWDTRTQIAKIFKNGELYNSTALTAAWTPSNQLFSIASSSESFTGTIDELSLYNRPVGAAEIAAMYANAAPPAADIIAPSAPSVSASGMSGSRIALGWTAATDDGSGIARYAIYRNGSLIANVASSTSYYIDTGLAASTSYTYTVYAYDEYDNQGAAGSVVGTTTASNILLVWNFETDRAEPTASIGSWVRQAPRPDSISVVDTMARAGTNAVRYDWRLSEWTSSTTTSTGVRAEITLPSNDPQKNMALDQGYWYGFSEFIPADWEDDYEENQDIVWQFHGANDGQGTTATGGHPPLAARIHGDSLLITLLSDTVDPAHAYFDYGQIMADIPIPKGEWSDWVVRFNSSLTDGSLQIWRNGTQLTDYEGSTTYTYPDATNSLGPYFKIGDYRPYWGSKASRTSERTVYADEIRIADAASACADVAPTGARACGGFDTLAPSVTVSAPTEDARVSGSSVSISAAASDETAGVIGVRFFLDDTEVLTEEDVSAPYAYTWDSTSVADGEHTLSASARDAAGNWATSTVSVLVQNTLTASRISSSHGGSQTVSPVASPATPGSAPSPIRGLIIQNRALLLAARSAGIVLPSFITDLLDETGAGSAGSASSGIRVRDLTLGSEGTDVHGLQVLLNANGFTVSEDGPGSIGRETTYFGPSTRSALARLQSAFGVVPASGYFGNKTRAALEARGLGIL